MKPPAEVVLITGGSSGIGRCIGRFLKSQGYIVYGTARNPLKYPDFNDFPLLKMDVQESASVREAVEALIRREERIDILINNAGVGITGPLEETPHSAALNAFETNLHGPLRMIQEVLPHMRERKKGFILNITSVAGYMGLPFRGIYSATKGALELVTEAYRMELRAFGIRMSSLAPGDFATNIASGRYHSPILEDSPYRDTYKHSLSLMDEHVGEAKPPDAVAHKVFQILRKKNPSVHYTVGSPLQRFSITLKKLLPDKLYERLLLNHYKL
ncbi:SDR family oxidoreductase [Robiginitalea aurantiaca]|uniref:SDR family oxidoreductase n=1 Tax=Robiginitalea aurantiaca TaxID=3056915 RepID=A0ABT7WG80_9FLAO|nr:SDR family oxidoreductase [Robiginitalea aurantiaca]MDM9631918.1 SDR family oxidoreductase [Robiginitalea aurantiaca]